MLLNFCFCDDSCNCQTLLVSGNGQAFQFSAIMLLWSNQWSSHQLIPVIHGIAEHAILIIRLDMRGKFFLFITCRCSRFWQSYSAVTAVAKTRREQTWSGNRGLLSQPFVCINDLLPSELAYSWTIIWFYIIFLRWIYSLAVTMQSMSTVWCEYCSLQFNPVLFVVLMGYTGKQPTSSLWQSLR